MSQPPLSRHISYLEKELSTSLIERSGKKFRLTEAGEFLYVESSRILAEVDSCLRQTRLIGESATASIRIAAAGSLSLSVLPRILSEAGKAPKAPRFEILEMSTENQAKAILSGRVDIGFLRDWADIRGLVFEALGREPLAIAYPAAWTAGEGNPRDLRDFAPRPFVSGLAAQAPGLAEITRELCAKAGFSPRAAFECDHLPAMLKLVAAGLGWAIVPEGMAGKDDETAILPLAESLSFGAAFRPGTQPRPLREMIETAKRLFSGPEPGQGA